MFNTRQIDTQATVIKTSIHAGQSLGSQLLYLHPAVTAATGLVALMGSSWSPIYTAIYDSMGIGQLHLRWD